MEASFVRPIFGEAKHHRIYREAEEHVYREAKDRVYRKAKLEDDACTRRPTQW
jgi:hypothetical protein